MDSSKDIQMNPYGRSKGYLNGLLVMLFIGMGFVILDRMMPMYLGTFIIKDLGLTNTQFGLINTTFAIGWSLSAVFFGYFSDRVGRRAVLIPAVIIMSLLSGGTGLTTGFISLAIVRLVMGVAESPVCALIPGIAQTEAPLEKRGLYTGIVNSSGALVGNMVAPVLGVSLAVAYGWRAAFWIIAVPGIILGLIMWKFLKEPFATQKANREKEKPDLRELFHGKNSRNVWIAAVAAIGFTGNNMVFFSFAPLLLIDKGFSPQTMSWVMSAVGLSGFLWMIVVPSISDRIGRRATMMIFGVIAVSLPLCFNFVNSPVLLIVLSIFLNTFVGLAPILAVIIPAEAVSPRLMGTALGINLLFGDLIGGSIAPYIGGALADSFGYQSTMYLSCGLILIIAVMGFFLKETAPRVLAKRAAKANSGTTAAS